MSGNFHGCPRLRSKTGGVIEAIQTALTVSLHLALMASVFSGALRRKCPQRGGNTLLQTPTALASKVGKEGVGHASDWMPANPLYRAPLRVRICFTPVREFLPVGKAPVFYP